VGATTRIFARDKTCARTLLDEEPDVDYLNQNNGLKGSNFQRFVHAYPRTDLNIYATGL